MKRLTLPTGLVLLALLATACTSPEPGLVITDVMVASPERDAPYGPVSVRVVGSEVVAIDADVGPAHGDRVIDGRGRFLAPGLIDSHTHLTEIPGLREDQQHAVPAVAAEARARIPRAYLFHGFTTVIDLASSAERIAGWNGQPVRPQAYFCGPAPVMDGYPTTLLPVPDRYAIVPDFLVDPERNGPLPDGIDPARQTPEAVASRIADSGAICIKTHYETGFGRFRNLPTPGVTLIRDLVTAAHGRGLPVLLHANSEDAHAFGLDAGVDALVHGMWNWRDGRQTVVMGDVAQLLDRLDTAGIALQPTIQVLQGEADVLDPAFLDRPALRHVVPASLLDWYRTPDGQWFRDEMLEAPPVAAAMETGDWRAPLRPVIARVSATLSRVDAGRLLFGSDTPSGPIYANPHGLNGRWEMDRWLEAGIPPATIFRAATLHNAEFFGLDDAIGTVAIGKRADLLLLEANPFESVTAFDSLVTVFVAGEPFGRHDLSATSTPASR